MREILFRGFYPNISGTEKIFIKGRWIKGIWVVSESLRKTLVGCCYMHARAGSWYIVEPETVGQYTGLTDKNGTMIFEGDIVKNDWCSIEGVSVVRFGEYKDIDMARDYPCGHVGFYLHHCDKCAKKQIRKDILYFAEKCEVIGNIHDNPELISAESEG